MPTVTYNKLPDHLQATSADTWPAVTLIFGEELLCQKTHGRLLDHLVDEKDRSMGVEVFDGGQDGVADVLASMNTYALLSQTKIVVLTEARLFYSSRAQKGLQDKVASAARKGEWKKASRPLLSLMAILGLRFEDLDSRSGRRNLVEDVDGAPPSWFTQLIDYCKEKGLRVPDKGDDAELVKRAMEKGFPKGHHLLLVTDIVDRRKALFKAIDASGLVVDCSVPTGQTRADRTARDALVTAAIDSTLNRAGKRMAAAGRRRLMEWTGFDLRTLAGNLEKLISYAGDRKTISDTDVTAVLKRTRKDPIFEFTNAVGDRDLSASLFFLKSLTDDGLHPLQLLSALANQIRRLLVAKDFIRRNPGVPWSRVISFPQFKSQLFPAIQEDDGTLAKLLAAWDDSLQPKAKGTRKKKAPASDLVLAKNPRSPFPVFQTLKKAERFSRNRLMAAMAELGAVDRRMKSTGQDPLMLLEHFLVWFCNPAASGPTRRPRGIGNRR